MYLIGDVHGCADLLARLLKKLLPTGERLIFLGDYVNKGDNSKGVIEQLIALRENADVVLLKGNHDRWIHRELTDEARFLAIRGYDLFHTTLRSYLPEEAQDWENLAFDTLHQYIPQDHFDFLRTLTPYYEDDTLIAVHAALDVSLPLAKQSEEILLRARPWDTNLDSYQGEKYVAVGHTPTEKIDETAFGSPLVRRKVIYMDTAPVDSGRLCALHLPSFQVVSSDAM